MLLIDIICLTDARLSNSEAKTVCNKTFKRGIIQNSNHVHNEQHIYDTINLYHNSGLMDLSRKRHKIAALRLFWLVTKSPLLTDSNFFIFLFFFFFCFFFCFFFGFFSVFRFLCNIR